MHTHTHRACQARERALSSDFGDFGFQPTEAARVRGREGWGRRERSGAIVEEGRERGRSRKGGGDRERTREGRFVGERDERREDEWRGRGGYGGRDRGQAPTVMAGEEGMVGSGMYCDEL